MDHWFWHCDIAIEQLKVMDVHTPIGFWHVLTHSQHNSGPDAHLEDPGRASYNSKILSDIVWSSQDEQREKGRCLGFNWEASGSGQETFVRRCGSKWGCLEDWRVSWANPRDKSASLYEELYDDGMYSGLEISMEDWKSQEEANTVDWTVTSCKAGSLSQRHRHTNAHIQFKASLRTLNWYLCIAHCLSIFGQ